MFKLFRAMCIAAVLAALSMSTAFAFTQPIALETNQTYYLTTATKITRIAVANPKIADVTVVGASALNIVALDVGSTGITVWTDNGEREEYIVTVTATDSSMAKLIEEAID